MVGAYRSSEVGPALEDALAAWRSAGHLTEVPVGPIAPGGVQALIADLMGRPEGPPAFAAQLHRRTGGNPMFVLETLKALFEAGVLRADAEGWHTDLDLITRDYAELDVPPAVSDVIARRLAHLDERTVRVLEAVAVARAALDPAGLGRYDDALRHYGQLADLDAQPHLQVIALARSAECYALLGQPEGATAPLEQALDRLAHTDFPVAICAAAIVLLRFGDDAQVARLRSLVPDLDPSKLPPHQRERLAAALAARA